MEKGGGVVSNTYLQALICMGEKKTHTEKGEGRGKEKSAPSAVCHLLNPQVQHQGLLPSCFMETDCRPS